MALYIRFNILYLFWLQLDSINLHQEAIKSFLEYSINIKDVFQVDSPRFKQL